jgi:hypothetical protein
MTGYPGSALVFAFFVLCFCALVALVFPRPRLYGYGFLAVFLAFGFLAKVLVQSIWAPGFIEPVGSFAGTPQEWDAALLAASCAALGLAAVRVAHLIWRRRAADHGPRPLAPAWFRRWRRPVWVLTLLLVVGLNLANLKFAFFQVGVNPLLVLPWHLTVPVIWLLNIGLALWIAALAWWDSCANPRSLSRSMLAAMAEAFLASTSAFSRIIYVLHAGPYWLVLLGRELRTSLTRSRLLFLAGAFAAFLALSIAAVSVLRVFVFYGYAAGAPASAETLAGHAKRTAVRQLPELLVHRWIGLEGVLAAGSAAAPGAGLLVEAITDDPRLGGKSLFQRVAKVHYLSEKPDEFTFLSNAGPVAVLLFSGSLTIVFAGMALIGLLLVATEEAARRVTGNPFLLAVSGAALANVVSQTTFFYLTMIFLLQMWVAIGFIAVLQRLRIGER